MATGFQIPDGRDLSDIFSAGDAGLTTGFQTSNGIDVGRQFMGGSTGIATGFQDPSGIDLGSRFGNDPWVSQGYTPVTMLVGYWTYQLGNGSSLSPYYTAYKYGFGYRKEWHGSFSDLSLLGANTSNSYLYAASYSSRISGKSLHIGSDGSKRTSAVINGAVFSIGDTHSGSDAEAIYDYFVANVNRNITIYLK